MSVQCARAEELSGTEDGNTHDQHLGVSRPEALPSVHTRKGVRVTEAGYESHISVGVLVFV